MKYFLLLLIIFATLSCLSQNEKGNEETNQNILRPQESKPGPEQPAESQADESIISEAEPQVDKNIIKEEEPQTENKQNNKEELNLSVYQVPLIYDGIIQNEEDLPLPEYVISFYTYLPLGDKSSAPLIDVAYPVYRKPSAPAPAVVKKKPTAPVKIEKKEPPLEETPSSEVSEKIREERYSLGIPIHLVLEGTDWVYMGEEGSEDPGFQERKVLSDRTLFTFAFPLARTYVLLFHRQDHSTGDSQQEKIRVVIEADTQNLLKDSSVKNSESKDVLPAEIITEEETAVEPVLSVEQAQKAQSRLEEIEENPEEAEETLELLEFLVNVESDNHTLAGYYYRMARLLEMNSKVQDLKKAYDTYKYITDHFFLTDYYELSEERIRFLDRHFFKLR